MDELVVFNEKEEREVLDLMHKDDNIEGQTNVYEVEGKSEVFAKNRAQLKALSLAMLLARNPKETDLADKFREIFLTPREQKESQCKVRDRPGFHFHHTITNRENEFH